MPQHSGLTQDRWLSFSHIQQILMIGNEMNRAKKLFSPLDINGLRLCYERVLYLTDFTIQSNSSRNFIKELLRWRDLVAEEYISLITVKDSMRIQNINNHLKFFKILLLLSFESAGQIPYLIWTKPQYTTYLQQI